MIYQHFKFCVVFFCRSRPRSYSQRAPSDPYDHYYRDRYPPPPPLDRYRPYADPYDRRPPLPRDPYYTAADPYARPPPEYYGRRYFNVNFIQWRLTLMFCIYLKFLSFLLMALVLIFFNRYFILVSVCWLVGSGMFVTECFCLHCRDPYYDRRPATVWVYWYICCCLNFCLKYCKEELIEFYLVLSWKKLSCI